MYFPKYYAVSQVHQNIESQFINKSPSKMNNQKLQLQSNNLHSRSQSSYLSPPHAFAINLEPASPYRQLSNAINSPSQKEISKNPQFSNVRKYRIERKLQFGSKEFIGLKGRKASENITIQNNLQNLQQKDDLFIYNKNAMTKSPKSANIKQRKTSCNLQFPTFFKWNRKDSQNSSGGEKKKAPTGLLKKKSMGWMEQNNFKFSTNLNSDQSSQHYEETNIFEIPKTQNIRKQSENESPKKQPPSFLTNKNHRNSVDAIDCPKSKLGINNFFILKQLGNGSFGRVVLAVQHESGMIFAIKIVSKRQIKESNMVEQLTRELKIQQFANHPNIIKVFGYFDDILYFYMIMECSMDANLSQTIKNRTSSIAEAEAATIMNQICQAVSYLHGQCIIHRDLKPDNILFHEGVVKITDFGWSVVLDGRLRTTFCGTPVYLCPQILMGDEYNESVDIWTIGVILYELFFKSNPFRITCKQQLINILNKPIYFDQRIEVSPKGKDFILACLKKRAAERPSIRQLLLHDFLIKATPIQEQKRYQ